MSYDINQRNSMWLWNKNLLLLVYELYIRDKCNYKTYHRFNMHLNRTHKPKELRNNSCIVHPFNLDL